MSVHPEWATKFRSKGTELRFLNGKYYLYQVTSKWNPEKKRSQKITGKLLGKITENDGFVESDKEKLRKKQLKIENISVKEYGVTSFITTHFNDYFHLLQKHLPEYAEIIMILVYCRLIFQSPLKNAEFHYLNSYLSELFPNLQLSSKQLSSIMKGIGQKRNNIVEFFKEFNAASGNIIFDGTDIFCNSKNMDFSKYSKSKRNTFDYVANIMFAFSNELQLPAYYRILPGNIKDIKAFKLCMKEVEMKNAVVIVDKGFYSADNLNEIRNENLKFIIPLKRNNNLIKYDIIKANDKKQMEYFVFEKRIIWYYTIEVGEEKIDVYVDDEMKNEEIKDYLMRIKTLPEKNNIEEFLEKQYKFGTIALLHNSNKSPEEIFIDYKSRMEIESMIDTLKNVLDADSSYMHNEQSLEAWMLINFVALHWYYKILNILKTAKLNKSFSPQDILKFLLEIKKIKINNQWYYAETTKKYSDILKSLNIHIT